MKDSSSHSYVVYARELLAEYDLPSVYHLLKNVPSKFSWKKTVLQKVKEHYSDRISP